MILVSGGTGLVGSHLLYYLAQKHLPIKAIHQKTSNLERVITVFKQLGSDGEQCFERIHWVEASLNDTLALQKAFAEVDLVYHCAAFISFDPRDYKTMRKVNIEGTANIVNLCVQHQVKKLCFVSSIAAIEKTKSGEPANEDENWVNHNNKSGYAISKYGSEIEVWRASQEGVPVVIVNPGVILGSGFWQNGSGALFSKIYNGFKFYTTGVTGFVDVIDVAKVMLTLMESDIKNERYILVSDNISFKDLFFEIADQFKIRRPSIKVTPWLGGLVWRLDYIKSKLFGAKALVTKHSMRSSMTVDLYDNNKIIKAIGHEFIPVKETIKRCCEAYPKA